MTSITKMMRVLRSNVVTRLTHSHSHPFPPLLAMCAAVGCYAFPFSSAQQTYYARACVAKFAPLCPLVYLSYVYVHVISPTSCLSFPPTTRSFFPNRGRQTRISIILLCSTLFHVKKQCFILPITSLYFFFFSSVFVFIDI